VLGSERGVALIETLDDYETIIVEPSGRLVYSSGFVSPE
jgi:hypothetical protein